MSQSKSTPNIPKQIYNVAHSFLLAAQRCNEPRIQDVGHVQALIIPAVVNAALSCELSIKAILQQSNSQIPKSHKINELFSCIPDIVRNEIIEKVGQTDFDAKINNISNVFIEWRYLYERDIASLEFEFLMSLAKVLCDKADSTV